MTPIVKHGKHMSQINVTPIYEETTISLKARGNGIIVSENDQVVAWLTFPIMKIVRGIRTMYPNAKLELI